MTVLNCTETLLNLEEINIILHMAPQEYFYKVATQKKKKKKNFLVPTLPTQSHALCRKGKKELVAFPQQLFCIIGVQKKKTFFFFFS